MTTRSERCRWCRARLIIPQDSQTITCTRCGVTAQLPPKNNNGFFPPIANNGVQRTTSVPRTNSGIGNGYGNAIRQGVPRTASMVGGNVGNALKQGVTRAHSFIRTQMTTQPNPYGPKRAVLCGVSYKGNPKSLAGSINDVMSMKKLLTQTSEFPNASVLVLTEDEKDQSRIPTKMNIRRALAWLVQGCQAGDSLVFHYSGHGSRVKDQHGDEIDGHDEALCPVDYETEGRIIDDEINATIVGPLPTGATLHAVIDTCYSGTFLDLPYMCKVMNNREGFYKWEDHRMPDCTTYKGTKGGLAICFSACDDHQTSGDTTAFTGTAQGAMTYSFVQTVEKTKKLNYGGFLLAMRNQVYHAHRSVGQRGPVQEPQLTSSEIFDIHLKTFSL